MKIQKNIPDTVIYQTKNGAISLKQDASADMLWASQAHIADIFEIERSVITKHIRNILKDKELDKDSVCAKLAHTAEDGKTYQVQFYSLDVILAVGYRTNSKKAIAFRQWATKTLKEHIYKGYTINRNRIQKNYTEFLNATDDKYWVRPHQRIKKDKNGKTHIEHVKGYCSSYRAPYHKIALDEKIPLDHLYYVLTIYGEARGEPDSTKKAIAWIIRNRLKKRMGSSYREIVLRKDQFSCCKKTDPNFYNLQHPGEDGLSDKLAWQKCKTIAEEIHNAPENDNPIPGIYNYFSGEGDPKKHLWEKIHFELPDFPNLHFVKL